MINKDKDVDKTFLQQISISLPKKRKELFLY